MCVGFVSYSSKIETHLFRSTSVDVIELVQLQLIYIKIQKVSYNDNDDDDDDDNKKDKG